MAEPKRIDFDSGQRAIAAAQAGRRTWLWIAVSLALHGALILFLLAGAASGGRSELAGAIDVSVVGPISAGEPERRADDAAGAPVQRLEAPPSTAPPETPPSGPRAPAPARAAGAPPKPPDPPKEIARPVTVEPDALAPPRRPDSAAAPAEPPRPPAETAPRRPAAPPAAAAPSAPPPPKAARGAGAMPKPAAARQGPREAPPGQTASLGAPRGGERLGRSDSDDTAGVVAVNVNPRFRQPPAPPHYPKLSIERDEEGTVLVRALVDASGAPQRIVVFKSSGYPLLDEAAVKAVVGWRFEPMLRDGRAVAAWVQVPVRFRLN